MGAAIAIDTTRLEVTPGSSVTLTVRIRNSGSVVDQFTVDVVGPAAAFASVQPATLSLFPAGEGVATVVFSPPRTAEVGQGDVAVGVRVRSQEDPAGSATEETTLVVLPFSDVGAELVPRSAHGSRQADYEVAIDNRGNADCEATISVADPDDQLLFSVDPATVVAGPDTATFVKLRARPRKRILRGVPQHRQFQVVVEAAGQGPVVLTGTMVQDAVLPRWLGRAVRWALLGLILLAVLWFALLKPTIKSAAKDAVKEDKEAAAAGITNDGGGGSGGGGGGSATTLAPTTIPGAAGATGQQPIDGRLFLTAEGNVSFTVPAGKVLQLTDIVLQNPAGESGRLEIRRDDTALLVTELANFRDLDYHFVAPIVFGPGQKLVLAADCTSPGCTPGAYFAGYLLDATG